MSIQKVNHNKVRLVDAVTTITAVGGTPDSYTSVWYDVSGWTDKRVSWEIDSLGAIDADIIMHISPLGYYELRELGTDVTTDDYEAVTLVTAHTAAIMASVDAEDIDELQRPFASMRLVVENDSAAAITSVSVWVEGWS